MATLELGGRRATSSVASFRVEFIRDWSQAVRFRDGAGDATSFQHRHWLDAWYSAFSVHPGDKLYIKPEDRVSIW